MIKVDEPVRPLAMVGILSTGILCGALLGAITNAVNGFVSPGYFIVIMNWHGVDDVWRASIAQGIFEGILFGAGFSLVFTVGAGLMTQASVPYPFAARHLVGIFAGTLACWIFGGTAAVYLASLSPAFYQATFIGVPDEFGAMLAYAWVGGSIWGIELGGLISVVMGLVILRANWLKRRSVMS
jgi:hypothetical protein